MATNLRRLSSFGRAPKRPPQSSDTDEGELAEQSAPANMTSVHTISEKVGSTLKRVGSFSRQKGRRSSTDGDIDDSITKENSAPPASGQAGIMRSLSFGRRRSSSGGRQPEKQTGLTSEDSSGQSTPTDADPNASLTALHGWLRKRHCKDKAISSMQWSRRYFSCDDARGTLSYSKGESKKPSVVLPLPDITSVRATPRGRATHDPGGQRAPALAREPAARRPVARPAFHSRPSRGR